MIPSKRSWALSLTALAVAAALPSVSMAQQVVRDAATGQLRAPTAAEAATLAKQVVRDAKTGKMRAPTAAEAAAMARSAKAPIAPVVRKMPGGGVSAILDESHMTYSVARVGANGAVEHECVTGSEAAEQAMQRPASFATPIKPAMTTARGGSYELQ